MTGFNGFAVGDLVLDEVLVLNVFFSPTTVFMSLYSAALAVMPKQVD